MTQRIFDADNPQDVKDLFDILPDVATTITKHDRIKWINLFRKDGSFINTCSCLQINWHDKKEIIRPVDKFKWIGCLCWFWDNDSKNKYLEILKKIDTECYQPYEASNGLCYINCRPARRDEFKFVEDV